MPCPLVLINSRLLPIVLFRHSSHAHHYQNNVHFKTSLSSNKKSGLRYPYASITLPQTTQHWNIFGTRTPFHRPATQEPLADFTPNLLLQPLHSKIMARTPTNITKVPLPLLPAPASQNQPIHPISLHYQCTFCGRIVIKAHKRPEQEPAPPIGTCLIKTGATWRHPVLGEMSHYIEGGVCRYERMDLGARGRMMPALLSWRFEGR